MNMHMLVHIESFCIIQVLTSFNSFTVEHVPKEIKKNIRNKNIKQRYLEYKKTIQLCMYNFSLEPLTIIIHNYTNLFSPYDFGKK